MKDIVKKLATELIWEKIYPERKVEVLSVKSELRGERGESWDGGGQGKGVRPGVNDELCGTPAVLAR